MNSAIEVSQLSKSFGETLVLDNININVPEGSVYGFLGNNGAGKSTLIRLLLGLLKPDNGSIKIGSKTITADSVNYKGAIGSIIEAPCLYLQLTPKEYLGISCKIKGFVAGTLEESLEAVGMSPYLNVPMNKFSLGMKQRIAIANALLGTPKLLILDEPTNGLDPAGMNEIRGLLKELPYRTGVTIFLSSHLLDEIQKTATHVGILHLGKIQLESPLDSLMQLQSSSLDLVSSDVEKLKLYLVNHNINAEILSKEKIRLHQVAQSQCAEINKQVINAGFELIESRFNQVSLEKLFLNLVDSKNEYNFREVG